MRNIFLFSLVLITLFATGCSTKVAEPMVVWKKEARVGSDLFFEVKGTYDYNNVSTPQNLAIAMKRAALHLKEEGFTHFTLIRKTGVPPMITNFKDLISYCYPENEGFGSDSFTAGSTSLESKCNLRVSPDQFESSDNRIYLEIKSRKKSFAFGTWEIDQVLNDKDLNKYISEAKKEIKKKILFKRIFTEDIYSLEDTDKHFKLKRAWE